MGVFYIPHFAEFEWQRPVIDFLSTPPTNPSKGDRYIISKNATGVWSGQENKIVFWASTTLEPVSKWHFYDPKNGMIVYIEEQDRYYKFTVKDGWKKTNIT